MRFIRRIMYWWLARYFVKCEIEDELPISEIRYYQEYKGKFYVISVKPEEEV